MLIFGRFPWCKNYVNANSMLKKDRVVSQGIEKVRGLVVDGSPLDVAGKAVGPPS